MADIVLISPRFRPSYWGLDYAMPMLDGKAILPVMALPLLAALTPPEHSVTVIDENVEEIDWERVQRADIVGVTGMIVQRQRIREILTELKRRNLFTVLGGAWITVRPEEFAGLHDVIFIGEAEETWPQFLTEWKESRHGTCYEQADKTDMAKVPAPRLDTLKMRHYVYGSMQISRGCPFTCEFCDIIAVFGRRPRLKTSEQIITELDNLRAAGKRDAFVVDDNLIGNKKAIKPVLRDIVAWQRKHGYPLNFTTEASIDLAEDDEMIELMVEANFESVFIGIESPNEESLRETKKIQNLADRNGTVLEKVHHIQRSGLEVLCGMIVGFDNDDPGVFAAQRAFVAQSRIVLATVNILFALPKTPLYTRLHKEGRLGRLDDHIDGWVTSNVIPMQMSRRELGEGYLDLMRDLYAADAYFGRVDALYLDGKLALNEARRRYLRRHPWRWLKRTGRMTVETLHVFVQLMRLVPDAGQRREYRRRLWNVVKRRPRLSTLRAYCVKCALHYHYDRLVGQMRAESATLDPDVYEMPEAAAAAE
jgi:radical SAM superfamily enzyme YgiQ (UPF0313 family)